MPFALFAGPYTADRSISATDSRIVGWATGFEQLQRGLVDATAGSGSAVTTYGSGAAALGASDDDGWMDPGVFPVVSLGDGGSIVLTFANPITDGAGADFAVFENGVADYLEFAFVEVSSDGVNFTRFDADYAPSGTPAQLGSFDTADPSEYHNLAGKYGSGLGTLFDLAELSGTPGLNVGAVTHVRIVDVVGSLDPAYGSQDANGDWINDPFTTPFDIGGFDLDAVGVLHAVPEPSAVVLMLLGAVWLWRRRG